MLGALSLIIAALFYFGSFYAPADCDGGCRFIIFMGGGLVLPMVFAAIGFHLCRAA